MAVPAGDRLALAVVVWVPGCLIAGWWQVNRAFDGNGLSYLYSVEWPVFAIVGIWMWWSLIHTDPETVGARAQRRLEQARAKAGVATPAPVRHREDEDEELAAYNDRLARLAAERPGQDVAPLGGRSRARAHERLPPALPGHGLRGRGRPGRSSCSSGSRSSTAPDRPAW